MVVEFLYKEVTSAKVAETTKRKRKREKKKKGATSNIALEK